MRIWIATAALALGLGGCASYHQEVAALRMARPAGDPALAAFEAPAPDYPSVGGDILKGAAPSAAAIYDATAGDTAPPPAP
jgi:hypothetical protein